MEDIIISNLPAVPLTGVGVAHLRVHMLVAVDLIVFFHGSEFVALNSRRVVKWFIDSLVLSDHCN